jgi:hypothetical protein
MLSLSSVALLAACGGGGEEEIDLSVYLPIFPAPVFSDPAFLGIGFAAANLVTAQNVNALLAEQNYVGTAAGIDWIRGFPGLANIQGTNEPLRSSGAAFAHEAGLTGAGQTIAFSDGHMSITHEALGLARVEEFSNGPATSVDNDGFSQDDEHGTSVMSVAAGNSAQFIGVAPGADMIYGWYGAAGQFDTLSRLGDEAIAAGAVAWNNSWGYGGLAISEDSIDLVFGIAGSNYYERLNDFSNQAVIVFAVSNDDEGNAGVMDALPYLRPELESGWLAAANGVPTLAPDGDVTAVTLLSSPCYQAARWCVVADGSWKAARGPGSAYAETTGSSFAAPQLSGAMALLAEAFIDPLDPNSPTLHQLRIRLLASADDNFAGFNADATVELADEFFKPYSVIYGHGFLDIEAALKPIGGVAMPTAAGEQIAVDAPILLTGSGLGDAVEVSLASTNLAVKDALSAGFVMPGSALTAGARPGSQAGAHLAKALRSNLAADRIASPAALDDPFAAFTGPVLEFSAPDGTASAAVLVPQSGAAALGFTLTRVLTDGPTKVELGLKLARDDGGLLSLGGTEGAAMASVALGVTQDLGNGAFMAVSGEMGLTDLGGDTALGNTSSARFDAVKLTAGQSDIFTKGDRLSVGVGMPIAIASGETVLDLPVSRAGLAASFEGVALDLAPENRQRDLELTYQTALADGLEMKLSLIHSDNFGNRAGETDTAGALAFAFRF